MARASIFLFARSCAIRSAAACLALAFGLLAGGSAARAQEDWTTWVGWKFGTTIAYPASIFSPLPEPDAHDGRTFVSGDGARIAAFGAFADGLPIAQIYASRARGPDYREITYRAGGKNWIVVSGMRDVDGRRSVFYERSYLQQDGQAMHTVVMTYPVETKAVYDKMVGRIVAPLDTSRYAPPDAGGPSRSSQGGAPASAAPPTEERVVEEPAFGFALRVPANWDFTRSNDRGIDTWTLRNRAWRDGGAPEGLIEVVVSVLERSADKDPVEEFRDFAQAFADEKLSGGKATEFGPQRMGAMSGFAARATGRFRFGDAPAVEANAVLLLFEVGNRHVLTWAIAPAASAALLDSVGQPGAIYGPSPAR